MLNDESFEKHVSQGDHKGNLKAADEDGFESDEEFVAVSLGELLTILFQGRKKQKMRQRKVTTRMREPKSRTRQRVARMQSARKFKVVPTTADL